MNSLSLIWLSFALCAGIICFAGIQLSRYGDVIASKTGLSGSWIGLILLATVTSLPELVSGISSVTLAHVPDIAVGNVLGSCVFNLTTLIVLDYLSADESVYRRASQGHILSAAFGILMVGFAGLNILLGDRAGDFALGHVGIYTPVIALLYFIAVRAVYSYEKKQMREAIEQSADRYPDMSLRQAVTRYSIAALLVLAAGLALPFIGTALADAMGWHKSFVGTLFIGAATALPELAVTIGALRIGAIDMAVSNLLGSNLFNVFILSIDDLFFLQGPILSSIAPAHAVSALSAIMMAGVVIVGLVYRPGPGLFKIFNWISLSLLALYILNSTVLFLFGE